MPTFYTLEKIQRQLIDIRAARHRGARPIPAFKFHAGEAPGAEQPGFDDRAWADFHTGEAWGGYDATVWFRARVPVPPEWQGQQVALHLQVGPKDGGDGTAESMLYLGGEPLQGLDTWHEEAWLLPGHTRGGELAIAIKAWSGVYRIPDRRRFVLAQLVWIDLDAHRLASQLETLLLAARALDDNDLRRVKLVEALNEAVHRVDFSRPGSDAFYASLRAAADELDETLRGWRGQEPFKPSVVTLGHAHIDMAWLWRIRHTREKGAHTFATALHLMGQYPEYRFMHSSPQLYKFLQQDYPALFEKVKARIAAGDWEATGGMWIEADTNLTGGESLVRQFLYGRRYLRDELGVKGNVLWLPDVFGYSAALPQLIVKSGMKYFLTTKISWSQFNRFPYDTFRWRGLDGTEVLTHFVTTPDIDERFYTYNGKVSPHAVQGVWDQYRQKDVNDELIVLYGWGDGGGGPTREMLEAGRVLSDLPGLPRVTPGLAEPFFERLDQRTAGQPLPVWDGELYLEYHRGTYTSQAAIKRANRQAEILYHAAEWLGATAGLLAGAPFPTEALREGWELILLNQFHDILPGSSIHPVYEDAALDHVHIRQIGEAAVSGAQQTLLEHIPIEAPSALVFNPLGWARDELIALPWSTHMAAHQVAEGPTGHEALFLARDVPALGYAAYPLAGLSAGETAPMTITPRRLENRFYRLELNERGQITSLFDKRRARQVLAPGARANVLQAFEDRPIDFEAWDIDIYYQEKMTEVDELVEAVVEEAGPLRGVLRLTWRLSGSTTPALAAGASVTQRLTLYDHSPRIDFRTEIDWHAHQVLLKAAFPVAVRATRATYEVQFGSVERPTHWNTSWDWARFEVPAHKWADLSEGDYGVALLNDCKYGHDIKDNVLRLTLIKSGIDPDPQADQGHHVFTYSLLPHAGDWRAGDVTREAYALNYPMLAIAALPHPPGPLPPLGEGGATLHPPASESRGGDESLPPPAGESGAHGAQGGGELLSLPSRFSLARLDADHVILETVKPAEAGEAVVFRVYEYQQRRNAAVTLTLGRPIARAAECNLMEEAEAPVEVDGDAAALRFAIAPFEIKTFKVWFQP